MKRDERGVAYPSPLVMLSVIAVAMAGIAFVATKDQPEQERRVETVASTPTPTPEAAPEPAPEPEAPVEPEKPAVERGKIYVEVYNNTGIKGLAASTADKISGAGWQVVGTDNWVGTIPATDGLLPPAAQGCGRAAGPGPGHPAGAARGRPDEAGPVDRHPDGLSHPRRGSERVGAMEFPTPQVADQYADVVAAAETLVVGLDFDGTLAPIVDDPTQAHIHPDAPELLLELATRVRGIAVVTGRPARQALALGDLDVLGARVAELGKEFHVLGQYGNERWTSTERRVISPRPPHGLASFVREVPTLLRAGAGARRLRRAEGTGGRAAHPQAARPPGRLQPDARR